MVPLHSESREVLAMKAIYGPFDQLGDEDAKQWTAPEKPGAGGHKGRYLWTDAFGVINFINLAIESSSVRLMTLAKRLVHSVHETLGRTRDGAARLNGATDEHPLKGGLRIGKMNAEGEDCDGQYHHYLTLWMFALNRLSVVTEMPEYNDMAIELADSAFQTFVSRDHGVLSMAWKVSVDRKTTLVPTQGHLDPITGSVICRLLQDTAASQGRQHGLLEEQIEVYKKLAGRMGNLRPREDPLDLGMGLWISQIYSEDSWTSGFKARALTMAEEMLQSKARLPVSGRLAFREFGACLGILCGEGNMSEVEVAVREIVEFWEGYVSPDKGQDLQPISKAMYVAVRIPGVFRMSYVERSKPFKWLLN